MGPLDIFSPSSPSPVPSSVGALVVPRAPRRRADRPELSIESSRSRIVKLGVSRDMEHRTVSSKVGLLQTFARVLKRKKKENYS